MILDKSIEGKIDWSKYPKTKRLMDETGMTLEQLYIWTEIELSKQEGLL